MSRLTAHQQDDRDAAYVLVEVRQRELREAVTNNEAFRDDSYSNIKTAFDKYERSVMRMRRVEARSTRKAQSA